MDEYGLLDISSELIRKFYNMNVIVENTGVDASSFNEKIETPNKTLVITTVDILLNSSHKKELWNFVYLYTIWISIWYTG